MWLLHAILASGTTRSRHQLISKEIYFAMCKIRGFAALYRRFECERPEVLCEDYPRKINAFGMRDSSDGFASRMLKRRTSRSLCTGRQVPHGQHQILKEWADKHKGKFDGRSYRATCDA